MRAGNDRVIAVLFREATELAIALLVKVPELLVNTRGQAISNHLPRKETNF
jgi:hypothetical protein